MSSLSKRRKIQQSTGERIFDVANVIFLSLFAFAALYPFLNTIANSLSSNRAILAGEVYLWPIEINFEAYNQIWMDPYLFKAMRNTVILTVFGTAINMVATILAAYPLSRPQFPGKNLIMVMITITMFFGGGLIPTFVLMNTLGLMNKYFGLWILSLFSTYNMIVMRTFFQGLPAELEESAAIEGANDIVILVKIMLPLSMPVLATLTLFYAVGWWNSYMGPLLYISDPEKVTLMLKLRQLLWAAQTALQQINEEGLMNKPRVTEEAFKAAAVLVSTIPIILVYPFLQKYFVKGVMVGALKG